jgi:hypothetical protein
MTQASVAGRVARGLVLLVTVAMVVLTGGPVAANAADDDRLMLSADGVVWERDLAVPIFDPAHLWVPGDRSTHTVWARNGAGEPAEVFGELDLVGDGASLFTVRVRVDERPWSDGHRSEPVTLDPGQVAQVQMQVTLRTDAANPRQQVDVPVSASITLRGVEGNAPTDPDELISGPGPGVQPGSGTGGPQTGGYPTDSPRDRDADTGTGTGHDELATTGTSLMRAALMAALMSGAGWWLLAAARRRRKEERDGAHSISASGG